MSNEHKINMERNAWKALKPSNTRKVKKNRCESKIRYRTFHSASEALREYMDRVLFTNMVLYKCKNHECYHLGHQRFMGSKDILYRTKSLLMTG